MAILRQQSPWNEEQDLASQIEKGQFRLDLYHRIAGWTFRTVPLNQRRQDIPPLATHFLRECFRQGPVPDFDSAVRDYLVNRDYPGNVRELFQLVRRIGNRHVGKKILHRIKGPIRGNERADHWIVLSLALKVSSAAQPAIPRKSLA